MTAGARTLTTPAKTRRGAAPATLTMPMADLRTFANALKRLDHDVDALLASAGISRSELKQPDARISCEAAGAFIGAAQHTRFTPNLGLAFAQATPLGSYPLLDYLVSTADTVGSGLVQLARYLRVTDSPVSVDVHLEVDPVRVEVKALSAFGYEFEAALIVLRLREAADGALAVDSVNFQHQPDDVAAFERALECPVRTGASWNGVAISKATCDLSMRRRDPILRGFLESQADAMLAGMPARTGVASEVQRVLASRGAAGAMPMSSIARQLGMSERTLQRRLASEGVSFLELLDDARKSAAARYLDDSALAIGEIAYLLGYSEPAAFHRAFKRWYASTPERYRSRR